MLGSVDTLERSSDWWGIERYYELSSDEEDEVDERTLSQRAASTSGRKTALKEVRKVRSGIRGWHYDTSHA